jgi:hypothetical protein
MTMRALSRPLAGALLLSAAIFLGACSARLGYGVLLWELLEYGLEDGEVLPVYVRSTISQVYVAGLPETDEKIEIPLWQITPPVSKRKALSLQKQYLEYQRQYARTLLDGLPIRAEAVNTARQVYRLRKDEAVKVLYKGEGQPVMAGAVPLEGDWLRVLTSDGTEGWCFSYNLRLYDSRGQNTALAGDTGELSVLDELMPVFEKNWRPESYLAMIVNNTIDLTQMNIDYGFTIDPAAKTGRMYLSGVDVRFEFAGIVKGAGTSYVLEGSPVTLNLRNENLLAVSCVNDRGVPANYNFIPIDEPVADIIDLENQRRAQLYENLLALGPNFVSENYGTLRFADGNTVTWTGNDRIRPFIISAGSGSRGTVEFKYFLSGQLKALFDGVVTITLAGSEGENNFFYTVRDSGLQLEAVTGITPQNSVFSSRSANTIVLFFAKQ